MRESEHMNKSLRSKKSEILYNEFMFCDLEEVAKIVATQVSNQFFFRIVNKFRRLRNVQPIKEIKSSEQ